MTDYIDLREEYIQRWVPTLLQDKTTKRNLVFATESYAAIDPQYSADREITTAALTKLDIKPRILKSLEEQSERTRKRAEVFTPAWLCCKMNNHCDDEWFGVENVFNRLEGEKWTTTSEPITFPKGKTWQKYVDSRRLEITCGEAPFIVSRYDAATGSAIEIKNRIGILDRKLRVVNENTNDLETWFKWALRAFQSVYGYEWQGDSLFIARVNLLATFIEYYEARWGDGTDDPDFSSRVDKIANVVVWNFWQMDGLTGRIPYGEIDPESKPAVQTTFAFYAEKKDEEEGDAPSAKLLECRIFDWRANNSLTYSSLKNT